MSDAFDYDLFVIGGGSGGVRSARLAAAAGFKAPILHGLCSLGTAGHAILKAYCDYDARKFKSLKLRFASANFP